MNKGTKPEDERAQFMLHVSKGGPDECWPWTAFRDKNGYGWLRFRGGSEQAHRVAHTLFIGPIPAGHHVHHTCDNPPCVNYRRHLKAVTPTKHHALTPRSIAFANKRKTHCPKGHPYDKENTRWYQGRRYCRTCDNRRTRS